jgi:hypothetical protein
MALIWLFEYSAPQRESADYDSLLPRGRRTFYLLGHYFNFFGKIRSSSFVWKILDKDELDFFGNRYESAVFKAYLTILKTNQIFLKFKSHDYISNYNIFPVFR